MILEFNSNIVLLSYGVAFIGIYVAVSAAEQFRGIFLKYRNPTFIQKLPWLSLNGIGVGVVAFWGMHSIAMSGITLRDDTGKIVPIQFNIGISMFAILIGFLGQVTGILIACGDRFYAKSKVEILEYFVQSRSIEEILSYSESYVTFLLISKELTYSAIGGIVACAGLIGVHFLGMAAVEFPGYITFDGGIICAALLIGLVSAVFAYWLFFRLLSIFPNVELIRIAVPFAGGLAVCGVQYIAIIGTNFHIDYSQSTQSSWKTYSMKQEDILYPVLLAAMVTLWAIAMIIFTDLREKTNAYRAYLQKLSPDEKMSDLLLKSENFFDGTETSNYQSGEKQRKSHALRKGKIAPNDDESVL